MRALMVAAVLLTAAGAVAGCGESKAGWVDLGMGANCPGKDWDAIPADFKKEMARQRCGAAGKAFQGDWRCKDGSPQLRCG